MFVIVLPYLDRYEEQNREEQLGKFRTLFRQFFTDEQCQIVVVEQNRYDGRKFNRGKLLNIGFNYASHTFPEMTHVIFHDVDLIPSQELIDYYLKVPEENEVLHLAGAWNRYMEQHNIDKKHIYIGGVLSLRASTFQAANGFPNNFFGWGGEDDELSNRLFLNLHTTLTRPETGSYTDLENLSLSQKMYVLRKNREWKCLIKDEILSTHNETWRVNGLSSLNWNTLQIFKDNFDHHIVVDVLLNCDISDSKASATDREWGY